MVGVDDVEEPGGGLGPHQVGVQCPIVRLLVQQEDEPQLELPCEWHGEVVHPLPLHLPVALDGGIDVGQGLLEGPEVVQAIYGGDVVGIGHVGQPHLHRVVNVAVLVVGDAHDHAGPLPHGQVVGIARGLPPRAQEVELGEVLPLLGDDDHVRQGDDRGYDGDGQDDGQGLVQARLLLVLLPCRLGGGPGVERQERILGVHPPPRGHDGEHDVEHDEGQEDRCQANAERRVVESEADERYHGDADAERKCDALDEVQRPLVGEQGVDQHVTGEEQDEGQAQDGPPRVVRKEVDERCQ